MNLKNIKLKSYITMEDFFLYDIQGEMEGSIEVQFDNNKFNGNILYCENDEIMDGEWIRVEDTELYEYIKGIAIKEYEKEILDK